MIYLELKNHITKEYSTNMSLITHLDTVVNTLMSREDYRDNDRSTIRTLVEDALKIAQKYITTNSKSSASTSTSSKVSSDDSGKRAPTAYIFFGQCFNNPSEEKKTLIDEAIGRVYLSASAKYAAKTAIAVDALTDEQKETLFVADGWESATEAYATIRKEGILGFSTNAFLWNNLTDEQKKAVADLQKSGTMPTGTASKSKKNSSAASKTTTTTAATTATTASSGKTKNGHNDIKTMISAALALPADHELRKKLSELQENPDYAGKNSLTLGVAIWKQLDDDSKGAWDEVCSNLPSDKSQKLAEFANDSQYYELLQSTVEALL
jgi:hypothetical protein